MTIPRAHNYSNHGKPPVSLERIRQLQAEGKSITEISEITGISRQAIYGKMRRELKNAATDLIEQDKGNVHIIKMGDDNVGKFVDYHIDLLKMGRGVDKKDPNDLYNRFTNYLLYCSEHNIVPNNMSAYLAMGCTKKNMSDWRTGLHGTPQHRELAEMITSFFASIHEQGGADGVINPILAIFWQKAHDGLSDQPKIEVQVNDPLGEKRTAEQIAQEYSDVELPD